MLPALAILLAASPMTDVPTTVRTEAAPPSAQASPAIPLDKLLHASISANLTLGVSALFVRLGLDPVLATALAAGTSIAVGALKELVWDLALGRGTPDLMDMAANLLGTGAGVAVSLSF